jgi:hypothetical protein
MPNVFLFKIFARHFLLAKTCGTTIVHIDINRYK